MTTSEEYNRRINTDWVNYLESIALALDKKCSGLSNYKWGYFMDPAYSELISTTQHISSNISIGYIYCLNNLALRFRFTTRWKSELSIIVDTAKYGEATSFALCETLPCVTVSLSNYNLSKTVKLHKKASLLANDVISMLVPGEEAIKSVKQRMEQFVAKQRELELNLDKIRTALNLDATYIEENYRQDSSKICLPHVGFVELLGLNLCKLNTSLYLSVDILIDLIKMIETETLQLGKPPRDRYYSK